MQLQCHACGKKFRSANAEARHRHNFPAMCTRNRTFERFTAQCEIDMLKEKRDTLAAGCETLQERVNVLEYQLSEIFGTYDEWAFMPCRSLEDRMRNAILRARVVTGLDK